MVEIASLRLQVDSRDAKRSLDDYTKSTTTATRGTNKLRRESDGLDTSLVRTGRTAQQTRRLIGGIFAGLTAAGVARSAFQSIADFETGLVGVGKTADISGQSLLDFGDEVISLRQQLGGVSTLRLLELSEAAGQLGIKGRDNLLAFSEALARLEVSSDVAGAEGAKGIARILGLTTDGIGNVEQFSSSLVALGNDAKASEGEILTLATTVSQALAVFRPSGNEVLSIATALREFGIEAELGGSAIARFFGEIQSAANTGGDAVQAFAQIAGVSIDQFLSDFETRPVQAFRAIVNGLSEINESAGAGGVSSALAALGVQATRDVRVFQSLAANAAALEKAFAITDEQARLFSEGLADQSALALESSKAFQTLSREVVDLVQSFGDLVRGQDGVRESTKGFIGDLADAVKILGGSEADDFSESARDIASALDTATDVAKAFVAVKLIGYLSRSSVAAASFAQQILAGARAAQAAATTTVAAGTVIERGFSTTVVRSAAAAEASLGRLNRTARGLRGALGAIGVPGITFALQAASAAAIIFGDDILDALSKGRKEARGLAGAVGNVNDALFRLQNAIDPEDIDLSRVRDGLKEVLLQAKRVESEGRIQIQVNEAVPDGFREGFEASYVQAILDAKPAVEDAARELAEARFLALDRSLISGGDPTVAPSFDDFLAVLRDLEKQGTLTGDAIAERFNLLRAPIRSVVDFTTSALGEIDRRIAVGAPDLERGFFRTTPDITIDPDTGKVIDAKATIVDAVEEIAGAAKDAKGNVDGLAKSTADIVPPVLTANVDAFIEALKAEAEQASKTDAELLRLQTRKDVLAAAAADGVKVTEDDTKATEAQADAVERARVATDGLIAAKDKQAVDEYVRALQSEVEILRLEERGLDDQAELLALQVTLLDKSSEAFDENRDRIAALLAERRKLEKSENLDLDFDFEITPLDDATQALQSLRSQVDGLRFDGDEAARIMAQVAANTSDIDPEKAAALARILGDIRSTQEELRTLQARDLIANVEAEVALLGKTEAQRRTALELTRLQIDAESDLGQSIEATFERLDLAERVRDGASGAAGAFGNFLRDARDGVDDIGDALQGLATDVVGELTDAFVIDPLVARLQAGIESIAADVLDIDRGDSESATAAKEAAAAIEAGAGQSRDIIVGAGETLASRMIAAAESVASILGAIDFRGGGGLAPFIPATPRVDVDPTAPITEAGETLGESGEAAGGSVVAGAETAGETIANAGDTFARNVLSALGGGAGSSAGSQVAGIFLGALGSALGGEIGGVVGDSIKGKKPPVENAKGGIAPFADGSTFMDSQTITAFRKGGGLSGATRGIVDTPTFFPLGLAGEAGPEAILPLLQDGRLPILGSDISLALKRDSAGVLRAAFDDPRAFAMGESFTTSIAPRVEVSAIAPPSDRAGRALSPSVEMGTLQRQLDGLASRLEQVARATQKGIVPRDRSGITERQAESDRARNRSFTRGRL